MKVHSMKILLDNATYTVGECVTGRLVVRTSDANLTREARIFLKFYDKLDVQWIEDELVMVGVTKRAYSNFSKPFQLNIEKFLDAKDAEPVENDEDNDFKFVYRFKFQLPSKLQGTVDITNARCQYFIKAYLSTDENVSKNYENNVNVFDEFFKTLNHTYAKQEVTLRNQTYNMVELNDTEHSFEAKSNHIRVVVTLPKIVYSKGDSVPLSISIEPTEGHEHKNGQLELHKLSFKLLQVSKLRSRAPRDKTRLFEELLAHTSRKSLRENFPNKIVVNEFLHIPENVRSSTTRNESYDDVTLGDSQVKQIQKNPIRVNYKISLEFWRNFLVDELDLNIPLLVDPEI